MNTALKPRTWPDKAMCVAGNILLVVAVGCGIQVVVTSGMVSEFVIPRASDILAAVPRLVSEEHLVALFATTVSMAFVATLAGLLVGIPAAWLLYRYKEFGQAYESWLGALFSAPIILLYPLFLVVFGRGVQTIVIMSFIVGIVPIVLNTYTGLNRTPPIYIKVARSFNMTDRQMAWKVILPAAIPSIMTGLRLALVYTLINTVAIEFLISIGGLGYLIGDLYDRYDLPGTYAAVCFVIIASVLFFNMLERLERWLTPR
ncbi:ABC transporter permease [Rhizobium sp. WYJ-E13]|uniref:ABC transporter permease n=1 Tax=Rhizobium sp. WYJ-E13 TaxID=2849093 RepID=UPI001C1EB8F1|nr:ABC transporter permease subunit [Rhizobium sp. WYJ-E13]QWW72376.1 ABC transporter permease subunit [Rhizobium sp. WYJ-E13]